MNYLTRLLLGLGLAVPMSVWAGDAGKFLNLYYKNKALYLGQYDASCKVGTATDGYTCVNTQEVKSSLTVRGAFYNVINGKWVSGTVNASQYQSTELNLRTNIDFGQNKSDGTCSENHNFLPFSGITLNGLGHTISNLCRVDKGNMINTASSKPAGVGLFGELVGKTVNDLKISNVHFSVADKDANGNPASTNAGDYQAVGALAPKISNSNVTNVQLKDIVIQAPLAGGLAGYIEGSTISGITMVDESSVIQISNERIIETGYIGSAVAGTNTAVFNTNYPYKVLLGGVAGAAYFSNFKDIDIAVQVKNEAVVDMSALGGLVGHFIYAPKNGFPQISNRSSKITNVNIHGYTGDDGFVKPVISGGTAMGGVLGALRRVDEYNSPIVELAVSNATVTKLEIKQSKVKISDADVPQPLYFGGIVGNGNLCSGGILQVTESKVKDVDINELLPDDAAFQYYMGGIAGYASCSHANNSGNRDDMFLTLTGSEATGRILLSSSTNGKTAPQHARVSAVIGGLVGDAMVSLEDNSTAGNETEVSINYTAKRATGVTAADSVIVGGIFGAVSKFNSDKINKVRLSDLTSKGSIYVVDDGITARIGGIVGRYPLVLSGEPKIDFNDVHVDFRGGSIVEYSGETVASNTSSSIGGLCGLCRTPELINHSSAEGSFMGSYAIPKSPQKDFYVGGLVGEADVHAPADVVVKNNYYIGTIYGKFNGGKGHAGYLFGYMYGDGLGNQPIMTSNYHYGGDNIGAIGYFSNYGDFTNVTYFNEDGFNKFVAKNNVRDGTKEDLQDGPNGSTNNGYATSSYMQSQDFADFLNSAWTNPEDQVWAYENNYPVLIKPVVVGSSSSYNESSSSNGGSSSSDVTSSSSDATSSSSDITSSSDGTSSSSANNGDSSSSYEESSSSIEFSSSSNGTSSSSNETSSSSGESSSSSDGTSSSSDATSSSSNETSSSSNEMSSSSENGTSSSSNEESSSSENGTSSSSYEESSSSAGDSSSSSAGNDSSSSSEDKSSSSSATSSSSSSVNDESSSSSAEHKKYLLDIAEPTATQDGKGLRMQFDSLLANMSENVDYHIQVVSQKGIYLDTIVDGKTVGDVKNGTWRLDPAPAGRYTVTFMITDGVDSIPYSKTFTSMESQEVATHSWQTLSLYAFCRDKGDECLSELEARFARQQQNWAAEQCEEMKAQVKNGTAPDDDYFYREMDDACAQANGLNATTAVYWWDESNPVGDYWQYRKFSVNDKFDSTRGYWYGPIDNEPLEMSLETPDMKDEIVWKLENKYSGWNLVANPFGWYVTLPKEKGLQFYKWDPEVSSYKEPDTLGPYEAIWVHTDKSMTYRIPLKAAIVLEEEKKSLNKSVAAEEWNLRVVLADNNGKRDSWNELAVGTASSLGEPPAGMGDRVNLSIMDGKKRLVKSVKPNADDLEWDLEVSATTTREGHLSFEGLEGVWAKGLHVYTTVDNETVEVVKDRPLDVKLSSKAKNVSVRVTKSAVVAAATKSLLKGLRVNQTPNVLNVGFDAAAKLAGAKVKISVVGIDGRIVATGNAVANAGTNAIAMKKPKQGVYFVKVKVGSQSAVTRIMVR